jgi:hypothetical protein
VYIGCQMINITCVLRQGGKVGYDPTWVDKLHNSIKRNVTLPYKFVCLSDCDVNCDRIELEKGSPGFWAKLQLFKPGLFTGPVMYFDLDTVICKNIDSIIKNSQGKKFVMWIESDRQIHSSAMMYWEGDYSFLWDIYKSKDFAYWKKTFCEPPLYGDQALISQNTTHELFLDYCPKEWFHIASSKDNNKINYDQIKILMFRKTNQKPSTMLTHPLVKKHWV